MSGSSPGTGSGTGPEQDGVPGRAPGPAPEAGALWGETPRAGALQAGAAERQAGPAWQQSAGAAWQQPAGVAQQQPAGAAQQQPGAPGAQPVPPWHRPSSTSQAPRTSSAWSVDLVVTVLLFVGITMCSGAAVVVGYFLGALSQYGCGWETSTRACNPGMGWQTALVEGLVLVAVIVVGGIVAVRVRRTRPLGWAVALGTAFAAGIAVVLTLAVLRAVSS